jgi:hypothetical protein
MVRLWLHAPCPGFCPGCREIRNRGSGSAAVLGCVVPRPDRFTPAKRPGAPAGWVTGPLREILPIPRFDLRTVQPVGSRYSDYTISTNELSSIYCAICIDLQIHCVVFVDMKPCNLVDGSLSLKVLC